MFVRQYKFHVALHVCREALAVLTSKCCHIATVPTLWNLRQNAALRIQISEFSTNAVTAQFSTNAVAAQFISSEQ